MRHVHKRILQKRRRRSHGHPCRNKETCYNQKLEPEFHLKQLFTTYHDNPISKLYISLRSLSYKLLRACFDKEYGLNQSICL